MPTGFVEVARGVHVLRYPVLDVNVTLVVGDGAALLVDTLSTDAQARELASAAQAVCGDGFRSGLPAEPDSWTVVNTHHHFDHCFGNAVVAGPAGIWGHEETAALLSGRPAQLQRQWYDEWAQTQPELAAGLATVRVVAPDHIVHRSAELVVGGRLVLLRHLGRGHTAGDLVVQVPDADVLVAGDLVEQSGPPSFEDAYPLEWPETVAGLRRLLGPGTVVVPGHGAMVDQDFVAAQHEQLAALAWLIRDADADGAPPERVAAAAAQRVGWPAEVALTAVRRGYAELAGRA